MIRFLTEADVQASLTVADAIDAIEGMFEALAAGRAAAEPRQRVLAGGAMLHGMIGAAAYLDRLGWKQYVTTRTGASFLVGLYSASAGELIALIQADRLGQLRTGAVSAVAVRRMTVGRFARLALFGCGWQAESQLEAILQVASVQSVSVYCRDAGRRSAFAEAMQRRLGRRIDAARSPQENAEGADLVVTITTSRQSVVDPPSLAACRLLVAAGSNSRSRIEFPPELCDQATRIVCDHREGCRKEAGELIAAGIDFASVTELAGLDLSAPAQQITGGLQIFKSVGMATADVALATRLLEKTDAGILLPM